MAASSLYADVSVSVHVRDMQTRIDLATLKPITYSQALELDPIPPTRDCSPSPGAVQMWDTMYKSLVEPSTDLKSALNDAELLLAELDGPPTESKYGPVPTAPSSTATAAAAPATAVAAPMEKEPIDTTTTPPIPMSPIRTSSFICVDCGRGEFAQCQCDG